MNNETTTNLEHGEITIAKILKLKASIDRIEHRLDRLDSSIQEIIKNAKRDIEE